MPRSGNRTRVRPGYKGHGGISRRLLPPRPASRLPGRAALPPPGKLSLRGGGKPDLPAPARLAGCRRLRYHIPGLGCRPAPRSASEPRDMFDEPPPSSRAGGGRWSAAQKNEAGAFERPRPGQGSLPGALGNAGSCRSDRRDHARRPDVRNSNPCTSKRLNYQPGFQRLPLLLKPTARPGHTGEQTCFRSQIWGVRGCTRHGSALILAKEEGCSQAIAQELLAPPQRMWMEGQFGPKYSHPALDLPVKTYPQHITNRDSSHSGPVLGNASTQNLTHPKCLRLHPEPRKQRLEA